MIRFMRSISEVALRGFAPNQSGLQRLMDSDQTMRPANEHTELNALLSGKRPNRLIFFMGRGDRQGLWSSDTLIADSPVYLSVGWWDHGTNKRIFLFVFACESAMYIRDSGICDNIDYAIGFDRHIFFEDLNVHDQSFRFWSRFLKKLRKTLLKRDILDRYTYMQVIELYGKTARRLIRPTFLHRVLGSLDYISLTALAQQAVCLREVEGAGRDFERRIGEMLE
jgi:hypothetical protein